jgi:hypothetical protein
MPVPDMFLPHALSCLEFRRNIFAGRREFLRAGCLSLCGLGLADLLASTAARGGSRERAFSGGRAKSCILIFMWGGPSQLDTWDPKPDAPGEVRGEFKPIATCVPGIRISEHFPRLAGLADQYAIVRSMTHDDPAHLSSVHHILTGRHAPKVKSDADPPSRKDSPHLGSVLAYLQPARSGLPPFVTMPWIVSHPAAPGGVAPGQNAGWLGQAYDPFVLSGDPNASMFQIPGLGRPAEQSLPRLEDRRRLLAQLDDPHVTAAAYSGFRQRAFDLISSPSVQRAFALDREPVVVRDRYGRHIHGQCLLLARRLIEAGARLVQVNWHQDHHNFWDTHGDNFRRLKNQLMPPADQGFSALLEDLAERGLLEETLLVWVGEFGRSPRITRANAGREHHPWCYSAVLAGGGIRGGQVYGKSDRLAAYPADNPVSPGDLTSTIYHALGVTPSLTLQDRESRLVSLTEGSPIVSLFG